MKAARGAKHLVPKSCLWYSIISLDYTSRNQRTAIFDFCTPIHVYINPHASVHDFPPKVPGNFMFMVADARMRNNKYLLPFVDCRNRSHHHDTDVQSSSLLQCTRAGFRLGTHHHQPGSRLETSPSHTPCAPLRASTLRPGSIIS